MTSLRSLRVPFNRYWPITIGAASLASLASLGNLGCGSSLPTCPAKGGTPWHEVTSRHFVLQTDLEEMEARATGDDLERLYTLLDTVVFPGYRGTGDRMTVVIFKDEDAYAAIEPRKSDGFFRESSPLDVERSPTMVARGDLHGASRPVFLHELTHRFMNRTFGYMPVWFNEGFAEYFSTARVDGSRVALGELLAGRLSPASFLPDVDDLVSATPERFYAGASHYYYEGAWSLAHLLQNDKTLEPAFSTFVAAINGGKRIDVAWGDFERTVGTEVLSERYRAYLDRATWQSHWQTVALPRAAIVDQVRVMTDEEVHIRWARTFGETEIASMHEELGQAVAHGGDTGETRYWRGALALREKRFADAARWFRSALAAMPDEPRSLYGLLIAISNLPGAKAKEHDPEIEPLVKRLGERATTPDELDGVADYFIANADGAGASALVERSLAIDPSYWRSQRTEARLLFHDGHPAEAAIAQEKAISHKPESTVSASLARDLARYKEAAAVQKRTESAPP